MEIRGEREGAVAVNTREWCHRVQRSARAASLAGGTRRALAIRFDRTPRIRRAARASRVREPREAAVRARIEDSSGDGRLSDRRMASRAVLSGFDRISNGEAEEVYRDLATTALLYRSAY